MILKKKEEHSILDAVFNIKKPTEEPLFGTPLGTDNSNKPSDPAGKRPWKSPNEECPVCGTLFPAGGICPGCGLHDEEMHWD